MMPATEPQNLYRMLQSVAASNPAKVAIVEGPTRTSYARLLQEIESLAGELVRRGIRPDQRVGLFLPNSREFVVGYFSILACGGVVVPFNEHYQINELLYFVDACEIDLILTHTESAELCSAVARASGRQPQVIFSETWREFGDSHDFEVPTVSRDFPLMIQFSSGSTGTPKRIVRTHGDLLAELDSLVKTLSHRPDDRFLGVAPFSHVNGLVRTMLSSLRSGATLYPVARFERYAVVELIEREKITNFIAVPFMFSMLAKTRFNPTPDFSSLRLAVSASAPMPENFNRDFYSGFGLFVRQLYGSTETGTISVNLLSDPSPSLRSVGTPLDGVEIQVWREDGSAAPIGEVGELVVKSPFAIKRYEAPEEVNRESFRDGFFLTGDLGRLDPDGQFYLMGRKKFFINRGGYKINPVELEELLESCPLVEEVAVVGVPTPFGDEKVKAVIVPKGDCDEKQIIEFCRGKVADFKIPSLVEFRPSLPKSSTGKVRKKMLVE